VIPKYANIKSPNTSLGAHVTTKKAQVTRIKGEIKFLHKKNDKLNGDLYDRHLKAAKEWGGAWDIIHRPIINYLNHEMELRYKHIDQKTDKLRRSQTQNPQVNTQFFRRVINKTDSSFTDEEMKLLNKGLEYSLITKTSIG
jgi:hypothetical protein